MTDNRFSSLYILKDCVALRIIQASHKPKKTKGNDQDSKAKEEELAAELDEFIQYLSQEIFDVLPQNIKTRDISGQELATEHDLAKDLDAISPPPSFCETVVTYSVASDDDQAEDMFRSILSSFSEELVSIAEDARRASLPPASGWKSTRTDACEICTREVPLTYHHLIPRSTHDKVLKRKWHPEEMLNVVAWLCR